MGKQLFIGDIDRDTTKNPINDRYYQQLLGINPTLSDEIRRSLERILFKDISPLTKEDLSSNEGIIGVSEIQKAKEELLMVLQELEGLTEKSKHIVVVIDSCFTNKVLLVLLRRILGKEAYEKYVDVVTIDYEAPSDDAYLEEHLGPNHTLIILGGSLSSVYSMNPSHYDGYLAQTITQVGDDYHQKFLNKRILGICFGQQLMANVIGLAKKNNSGIIATIQGPAQFSPSLCHITDLEFVNPVYAEALEGLSNRGKNAFFTAVFTRRDYPNFDLLNTGGDLGVVPLITDEMTHGIAGWGVKNGCMMGIQSHPEIPLLENIHNLRKNIKAVIPKKNNQDQFLENFEVSGVVKRDIDEASYVFMLLAFLKDIKKTYLNLGNIYDEMDIPEVSYDEAVTRLMQTTSSRVKYLLDPTQSPSHHEVNKDWLDAIDSKGRLLMNHILDWKVNRGIDEISEILGFQSLVDLILKHKEVQQSKNYIIRDLGAGDGNTITELSKKISDPDVIIYGTGDFIYFDLYSCITKKTPFPQLLPDELIILFVEKVINEFKKMTHKSTIARVKQSISQITFDPHDTIVRSSMTSKATYMFENEHVCALPDEIISNFDVYLPLLEEMKQYVIDHFYSLFSSSFQKIYISKFHDLYIDDPVISKIDFQFSIRATSHISGREYKQVISDFFYHAAKNGSIFICNGPQASYSSIGRLKELHEVNLDLVGGEMRLVYDTKTNYFSAVIITKGHHYDDSFFQPYLSKGSILVPLNEAYRSTFFRLDYFVRNFIVSNFKNHNVFWDYNTPIINTLKEIMFHLEAKDTSHISSIILNLINHIALTYNNGGVKYNPISIDILNNYEIDGKKLIDIISEPVYIPEWMNIHANRKY